MTDTIFAPELWAKEYLQNIKVNTVWRSIVNDSLEPMFQSRGKETNVLVSNAAFNINSYTIGTELTAQNMQEETLEYKLNLNKNVYSFFKVESIAQAQSAVPVTQAAMATEMLNARANIEAGIHKAVADATITSLTATTTEQFVAHFNTQAIALEGEGLPNTDRFIVAGPGFRKIMIAAQKDYNGLASFNSPDQTGFVGTFADYNVYLTPNVTSATNTETAYLGAKERSVWYAGRTNQVLGERMKQKGFGDLVKVHYQYGTVVVPKYLREIVYNK